MGGAQVWARTLVRARVQNPARPTTRASALLFIGIQPGGDKQDKASGEMLGWPARFDYETAEWDLARYMWGLFSDNRDLLMACNVTNANFFRAPRRKNDPKKPRKLAWQHASLPTRQALEKFCLKQPTIIVEQLQPKAIVVTGDVLWQSRSPKPQSRLPKPWNEEASLFGVRAIHVMHTAAYGRTDEIRAAICGRDAAIGKIAGLEPR